MPSRYEVSVQVELYRLLKGLINKGFSFKGIQFTDVKFEGPRIDGRPDLTVFARENGKEIPILVIETKRRVPWADPFSPEVIAQAEKYATWLGAPLFATCNENVFVLFETFKEGVPLPQRKLKDYKVSLDENFVKRILEEVWKFRTGVGKWLPLDDVFVQRLRSFHNVIMPFIRRALINKLHYDDSFKGRYIQWLKFQLFEYSDEVNERIVEQIAYILMNRLAFYKTLEVSVPELPELRKIDAEDGKKFSRILKGYFSKVLNVDYEPIFKESIFDEIDITTPLMHALNDFIEELRAYNLAKVRSDVLGRVYEELIPAEERHRLGQYYTPPPIVELIVEMCVKSPNDKVLDPACGSGSFLVKAYHKLEDLKRKENPFAVDAPLHEEILNQLYGIDINQFPAQLAAMNLATRNLKVKSKNIHLIVSDFFKVNPATPIFPPVFDVVATNPPYTRQEELEYKHQIRDIALTYTNGSKIDIDARASIYAYFFTHSAKFLKDKGRMGYITSNTWLDVGFGKGLKKFFLDNFKILAIVEFDSAVFGKALVNTCVSILEKAETDEERLNNVVKFIRLKKPMNITEVVNTIRTTNKNFENDQIRIVIRNHGELQPKERWGNHLRAPTIYFKLVSHQKMVELGKLAELKFGLKTGCNSFFILDKEKIKLWGIEQEYLKPIVTSIRDIKRIELAGKEISRQVLMVHEPKDKLEGKNVLKYIEHGEQMEITTKRGTRIATAKVKGVHNLRTCSQRNIWYALGKHEPPPIIAPYMMWKRVIFAYNKVGAFAPNTLHFIYPNDEKHIPYLLGILNSTLTAFLLELRGRSYGGGVLKVEVYEMKRLPVLNPAKLDRKEEEKIESCFRKLYNAQKADDKETEDKVKRELDNVIFDILGLTTDERKQMYEGLESLRRMRLSRKEVEMLVETAERWKPPIKVKRKRKIVEGKPTKRLDLWITD